nr:hypothetical protein [Desulfobulbaceae bacterium]
MEKRSRSYENESRFARCEICYGEIPIEFYFGKGEVVVCSECDTEYILEERHPLVLTMVVDRYDDENFEGLEYDY